MISLLQLLIALKHIGPLLNHEVLNVTSVNPKIGGCGTRALSEAAYRGGGISKSASAGELPWTIYIHFENPTILNAGALIHPKVVLTSAFFFLVTESLSNIWVAQFFSRDFKVWAVRGGMWQKTDDQSAYQERTIEKVVYHPVGKAQWLDFIMEKRKYEEKDNIALLFLETPFELNTRVNTICLPEQGEAEKVQTECIASSWGLNEYDVYRSTMKKTYVSIISRNACLEIYRNILKKSIDIHESFICVGSLEGFESSFGDFGSPLACPIDENKNRFKLVGIRGIWGYYGATSTFECVFKYYPVAFSDVSKNRLWIDSEMKKAGLDDSYYKVPK